MNLSIDLDTLYGRLKSAMSVALPGAKAQSELALVSRERFSAPPTNAKRAGVAVILYPDDHDRLCLLFQQRSHHESDRHSGQISFPGGAYEQHDLSLRHTATRETEEEIALSLPASSYIGKLTSLYIPVSNFDMYPFLFGLHEKPKVVKQEAEVAEIFGYPIELLLHAPIQYKAMEHRLGFMPRVPYYDLDGRMLWGATGMVTTELLHMIRNSPSLMSGLGIS